MGSGAGHGGIGLSGSVGFGSKSHRAASESSHATRGQENTLGAIGRITGAAIGSLETCVGSGFRLPFFPR